MWIELHQTLPRHPKLIRFAGMLRVPQSQAAGHLVFLWLWTLDYAPTGDVSAFGPAELSAGADFRGDAELFCRALTECRWLDADGKIHNWEKYAGRLLEVRRKDRERKALQRMSGGHPKDGVGIPTLPNPTVPNPTVPDQRDRGGAVAPEAKPGSRGGFVKPGMEELALAVQKAGMPEIEAQKFFDWFESNGWRVGKNPMRSWRGALGTWKARWEEKRYGNRTTGPRSNHALPPTDHMVADRDGQRSRRDAVIADEDAHRDDPPPV
jgi:hypothetical protein